MLMGKICLCCVLQPESKYQLECQGGWWDGEELDISIYGVDVGGRVCGQDGQDLFLSLLCPPANVKVSWSVKGVGGMGGGCNGNGEELDMG